MASRRCSHLALAAAVLAGAPTALAETAEQARERALAREPPEESPTSADATQASPASTVHLGGMIGGGLGGGLIGSDGYGEPHGNTLLLRAAFLTEVLRGFEIGGVVDYTSLFETGKYSGAENLYVFGPGFVVRPFLGDEESQGGLLLKAGIAWFTYGLPGTWVGYSLAVGPDARVHVGKAGSIQIGFEASFCSGKRTAPVPPELSMKEEDRALLFGFGLTVGFLADL